jgi:hypothetical protein
MPAYEVIHEETSVEHVLENLKEKPHQTREVPGHGLAIAGPVYCHRTVGQEVPGVYEQRAAIHATPSLPSTRFGPNQQGPGILSFADFGRAGTA